MGVATWIGEIRVVLELSLVLLVSESATGCSWVRAIVVVKLFIGMIVVVVVGLPVLGAYFELRLEAWPVSLSSEPQCCVVLRSFVQSARAEESKELPAVVVVVVVVVTAAGAAPVL